MVLKPYRVRGWLGKGKAFPAAASRFGLERISRA